MKKLLTAFTPQQYAIVVVMTLLTNVMVWNLLSWWYQYD
jgi:hypothetical protein